MECTKSRLYIGISLRHRSISVTRVASRSGSHRTTGTRLSSTSPPYLNKPRCSCPPLISSRLRLIQYLSSKKYKKRVLDVTLDGRSGPFIALSYAMFSYSAQQAHSPCRGVDDRIRVCWGLWRTLSSHANPGCSVGTLSSTVVHSGVVSILILSAALFSFVS